MTHSKYSREKSGTSRKEKCIGLIIHAVNMYRSHPYFNAQGIWTNGKCLLKKTHLFLTPRNVYLFF